MDNLLTIKATFPENVVYAIGTPSNILPKKDVEVLHFLNEPSVFSILRVTRDWNKFSILLVKQINRNKNKKKKKKIN